MEGTELKTGNKGPVALESRFWSMVHLLTESSLLSSLDDLVHQPIADNPSLISC